MSKHDFSPMTVGRIKPMVDRAGRASSDRQFLREFWQNSREAGATEALIQPEWGAVEKLGVYRFCYADNGHGMSPTQLTEYLNQWGGGGKAIGGEHENYGIGSKSSTLPGNHAGVIIASREQSSPTQTAVIILRFDAGADEYGLEQWTVLGEDDDLGVDVIDHLVLEEQDPDLILVDGTSCQDVLDAFIDPNQGTVTILCGMTGTENTFFATGSMAQFDCPDQISTSGHTTYLSHRFWDAEGKINVYEVRKTDPLTWARSRKEAEETSSNWRDEKPRGQVRTVHSIGNLLENGQTKGKRKPKAKGIVTLSDGTKVRWFLLPDNETYTRTGSGGWGAGVAVLYDGELYDRHGTPRLADMGINRMAVQKRVTLIVEPPINSGTAGVYPSESRSTLIWTGGKHLPWLEWSKEFYALMPEAIETALAQADVGPDKTIDIKVDTDRLKGFTDRLKVTVYEAAQSGVGQLRKAIRQSAQRSGPQPRVRVPGPGQSDRVPLEDDDGGKPTSQDAGSSDERHVPNSDAEPNVVGRARRETAGQPQFEFISPADFVDLETELNQTIAARWDENRGVIEGNPGFEVFREILSHYRTQYRVLTEEEIRVEIQRVYGLRLITYVMHTKAHQRAGLLTAQQARTRLSPEYLTATCCGIVTEDFQIAANLGSLAGKKRADLKRRRKDLPVTA